MQEKAKDLVSGKVMTIDEYGRTFTEKLGLFISESTLVTCTRVSGFT